ncbi:hypothetical protein HOLleu_06100 [Holothuria leucospilota]|uniref:Uncharacterized protein n=1 Tax=Holothuria leucospilota TaxID=206669 RepID=A0A9Q1HHU3_HOLLE|nr:hypothetical protein HOLleu_06100 [Holothuria leucospilota]
MMIPYRLLLLWVTLCSFGGEAADECGCPVYHPQQAMCNSDFAFMVSVETGEESPLPYQPEERYVQTHYKYNVTVYQVLMPESLSYLEGDNVMMWTLNNWCEFHKKLTTITDLQMKGLTSEYRKHCDQCQISGVQGTVEHSRDDLTALELFPGARSKFWTLDVGCFFNPAASVHNLVKDCESEVSFCKFDHEKGGCMWDLNKEFLDCFKKRGMTVSYRTNPNAAAVRRPSDCKYLQNKRLKKKCLRNILKNKKALKKQRNRQ